MKDMLIGATVAILVLTFYIECHFFELNRDNYQCTEWHTVGTEHPLSEECVTYKRKLNN